MKRFPTDIKLQREQVKEYVHLTTSTGNDLLDAGFYDEAMYHFQLGLDKILCSLKGDASAHANVKRSLDWQLQSHQREPSLFNGLKVLGKPICLIKTKEVQGTDSKRNCTSSYEAYRHSWMPSVSAALLYNCAVVHFEKKSYEKSKSLLIYTFEILKTENIYKMSSRGGPDYFCSDMSNLSFVLSTHYLFAHTTLQESRSVSSKRFVSSKAVLEVKKHCIAAMHLAERFMKTDNDVENKLHIAPIVSLLGYCRILEEHVLPRMDNDAFRGMSVHTFYGAAIELYDGHRPSSSETDFNGNMQKGLDYAPQNKTGKPHETATTLAPSA